MRIRPHHGLCIPMFTGKGYDERFTHHMTEVKEMLSAGMEIIIQEGCDEICERCPKRERNVCTEYEKVRRLDTEVMEACGLFYGDRVLWTDVMDSIRERIFDTGLFERICCDCEWYGLCTEIKEKRWKR